MTFSTAIVSKTRRYFQTSIKLLLVLLSGMATSVFGSDQFSRDFNDHVIYYNVFPSSILDPAIAQQYKLRRSKTIHTLNLAVHRKAGKETEPVDALLKGTVTNFFQQQQMLEFQRVKEGDSIYFLAQFRVTDDNPITFDFYIRPEGHTQTYELQFKRPLQ